MKTSEIDLTSLQQAALRSLHRAPLAQVSELKVQPTETITRSTCTSGVPAPAPAASPVIHLHQPASRGWLGVAVSVILTAAVSAACCFVAVQKNWLATKPEPKMVLQTPPAPVLVPTVPKPVEEAVEKLTARMDALVTTMGKTEGRLENLSQRSQGGVENTDRLLTGIADGRDQIIEIKQLLAELRGTIESAARAFGALDATLSNPVELSYHVEANLKAALNEPTAQAPQPR